MFAGFRRHQKWIWLVAIIVIIPSFVIFFTDYRSLSGLTSGNTGAYGSVNGRPINAEDFQQALSEARLKYLFSRGSWPEQDENARQFGWDPENEAYNRVTIIELLRSMQVHVGLEASFQFSSDLLERISNGQQATAQLLDAFDKQYLLPNRLSKADFERFASHEAGILHLISVAGVGGRLVTPQEAESIYRRENEDVAVDLVLFSGSNYLASVPDASQDKLSEYYTNNRANYRIKDQVQVDYVKFATSNYLGTAEEQMAKITNFTEQARAVYLKRGTNFYTDADGKVLSEEAAIRKIRDEQLDLLALRTARQKANEFVNALATNSAVKLADLASLAAQFKLATKSTEAFDEEGPKSLKVMENFARQAMLLTEQEPVSLNPVVGQDGVYVIGLRKSIPSRTPALEEIRGQVFLDYKQFQTVQTARERGRNFHVDLTNALGQARTFSSVCAEKAVRPLAIMRLARNAKAVPELPESFNLNDIKRYAFSLKPGAVSPFVTTADGGMVVFVRSKFPIDEPKMQADLPQFTSMLRQNRQFEAANAWLGKQMQSMNLIRPEGMRKEKAKR
jgi:hypothetical protein